VARDERTSYRISQDPEQVAQEGERLAHLTAKNDRGTMRLLERVGVTAGWRCLELGAGSGSIARWLCDKVGPKGSVVSVDVDTRFHCALPAHAEVQERDATRGSLGQAEYDLVHARAFLEHIAQREAVLDRMVEALRPGGWMLLEDGDWSLYLRQQIPEPFRTLSVGALERSAKQNGWDPTCGSWLLPALQRRGLIEVSSRGHVGTMHGGTGSAEWYVAGLVRAKGDLVADGVVDAETFDRAIAQARSPDFAVLSSIGIAAWGRKP
jgi:ubiquinone/menaquinone biosynthesis C-methylase UbiE